MWSRINPAHSKEKCGSCLAPRRLPLSPWTVLSSKSDFVYLGPWLMSESLCSQWDLGGRCQLDLCRDWRGRVVSCVYMTEPSQRPGHQGSSECPWLVTLCVLPTFLLGELRAVLVLIFPWLHPSTAISCHHEQSSFAEF